MDRRETARRLIAGAKSDNTRRAYDTGWRLTRRGNPLLITPDHRGGAICSSPGAKTPAANTAVPPSPSKRLAAASKPAGDADSPSAIARFCRSRLLSGGGAPRSSDPMARTSIAAERVSDRHDPQEQERPGCGQFVAVPTRWAVRDRGARSLAHIIEKKKGED
jgi:hypothetical protein